MTIDDADFEAIKLAVESGVTDSAFWLSRTVDERFVAIELMRQRAYGYDAQSVPKLQRVFEVVTRERDYPPPDQERNLETNNRDRLHLSHRRRKP